jgi:hypothetical protein
MKAFRLDPAALRFVVPILLFVGAGTSIGLTLFSAPGAVASAHTVYLRDPAHPLLSTAEARRLGLRVFTRAADFEAAAQAAATLVIDDGQFRTSHPNGWRDSIRKAG